MRARSTMRRTSNVGEARQFIRFCITPILPGRRFICLIIIIIIIWKRIQVLQDIGASTIISQIRATLAWVCSLCWINWLIIFLYLFYFLYPPSCCYIFFPFVVPFFYTFWRVFFFSLSLLFKKEHCVCIWRDIYIYLKWLIPMTVRNGGYLNLFGWLGYWDQKI